MRERVPLRTPLQRHDDVVVVEAHRTFPELADLRFGAPAPAFEVARGVLIAPVD
jgi:hypothetical protein